MQMIPDDPFPTITAENLLAEIKGAEYLEAMNLLDLTPIRDIGKVVKYADGSKSQFNIKVTGDPYAAMAKGPRDLP